MARVKRKCHNCRHVGQSVHTDRFGHEARGVFGCGNPELLRREGIAADLLLWVPAYDLNHTTKCREFWLKLKKDRSPFQ
ncbi:hypothetical protein LCGC14_0740970 [marine sediment metagenome]|uniref:Uncharacterized protein n=1 Tax=marine sediment metagenome TaxID=412755 RepID=A0A0F9QRN7_9ZZZZ